MLMLIDSNPTARRPTRYPNESRNSLSLFNFKMSKCKKTFAASKGLETKITHLSNQRPFHLGQPSFVISSKLTTMLSFVFLCIVADSTITYNDTNNQLGQPASQDKPTQTKIR